LEDVSTLQAKDIIVKLKEIEECTNLDIQFKETQLRESVKDGKKDTHLFLASELELKKKQEETKVNELENEKKETRNTKE